jgi:hypothetical protein
MIKKLFFPLIVIIILFTSCNKETKYRSYYSTLLINKGEEGKQIANLTAYDEDSLKIETRSYSAANGDKISGFIRKTIFDSYGVLYILTSHPDKVIATDIYTFKNYSTSLLDTLTNPRSIATDGWYLYVANNGNQDDNINPYISIYSIESKYILISTIDTESPVEDLFYSDGYLYAATENGIDIISTNSRKVEKNIGSEYGKTMMFAGGLNNTLYASSPEHGILKIDMTIQDISEQIDIPMEEKGKIAINYKMSNIYSYDKDGTVYKTDLKAMSYSPFFKGEEITGISVSPFSDKVYISTQNGTEIKLFSEEGTELATQTSNSGDYGFVFCSFVVNE